MKKSNKLRLEYIDVAIGTLVIISLSKHICKYDSFKIIKKVLVFYGRNTLLILCIHIFDLHTGILNFRYITNKYLNLLICILIYTLIVFVKKYCYNLRIEK